jgi:hypothetical protein
MIVLELRCPVRSSATLRLTSVATFFSRFIGSITLPSRFSQLEFKFRDALRSRISCAEAPGARGAKGAPDARLASAVEPSATAELDQYLSQTPVSSPSQA